MAENKQNGVQKNCTIVGAGFKKPNGISIVMDNRLYRAVTLKAGDRVWLAPRKDAGTAGKNGGMKPDFVVMIFDEEAEAPEGANPSPKVEGKWNDKELERAYAKGVEDGVSKALRDESIRTGREDDEDNF